MLEFLWSSGGSDKESGHARRIGGSNLLKSSFRFFSGLLGDCAPETHLQSVSCEKEPPTLSPEGESESIHICIIGRMLLVVVFDERSSLGLVKLRVKQSSRDLSALFDEIARLAEQRKESEEALFAEITDDDIDSLFN